MADIRDAFPSKYLKAQDLHGRTVTVTMDRVEYEPVGQNKEMKPVVYFRGKEKGIVLNKTNCNAIIKIANSADTDDWAGVALQLYPTETTFGGDVVDCIRVRASKTAKPAPPPPVDDALDDDEPPF